MEELYGRIMTRIFISGVVAGLMTIVICLLISWIIMPLTARKGIKKAEVKGHVVTGKLVKTILPNVNDVLDKGMAGCTTYVYEYEYGGKKYKYEYDTHVTQDSELKLYFRSDPSKARVSGAFGRIESEWKPIFWFLFILSFAATFFFF